MAVTNFDKIVATISAPAITSTAGAGSIGTGAVTTPETYRRTEDGVIITQIKFDLTGLACVGTVANDVIGLSAGGAAYIGRYVTADCGIVFKARMSCVESPGQGTATITQDIDIATNSSAALAYDSAASTGKLINGATMLAGQSVENLVPAMTANDYLYIVEADDAATTGVYNAGQYILTMYGHAVFT